MTRDEAEKIVRDAWPKYQANLGPAQALGLGAAGNYAQNCQPMGPAVFVKLAESLGILKLDEPKSAEALFKQELFDLGWRSDARNFKDVFECLNAANLKIVEK